MPDTIWREGDEIASVHVERPHVVILGAGASHAAFPAGDRNGKKLPVMRNLAETVGLDELLESAGILGPFEDFEAIYSDIAVDEARAELKDRMESQIFSYFGSLELPDTPTLYDHLVLSLRPKDVVATFNWDPFLGQAASRNCHYAHPPRILFLHGNVALSYCPICKDSFLFQHECPKCGRELLRSPLLYPIKEKDYQSDVAIASHWSALEWALRNAWALTIFGYGAPEADVEAVRLMQSAWGNAESRRLEQTEIIDTAPEDELTTKWQPFICSHHYDIRTSFYDSNIARFPRRSGEALWAMLMDCKYPLQREFPRRMSFDELGEWLRPRLTAEAQRDQDPLAAN